MEKKKKVIRIPEVEEVLELVATPRMWEDFGETVMFKDICRILDDWLGGLYMDLREGNEDRREEDKCRGRIEGLELFKELFINLPKQEEGFSDEPRFDESEGH